MAEMAPITDRTQFVSLVSGKTLTRPLVRLEVSPAGQISGMGAVWSVTGNWSWQGSYFCRDIVWGGEPMGYNCQEVRVNGNRMRFTSDKGAGDYAEFNLR